MREFIAQPPTGGGLRMADRREPKATGEPPFAARTPPAPAAYSPAPSAAASCCTPLATARSPLALLSVSRKSPSICSFSRTGARRPSVPQSQPGLHFSLSRRSWLCRSLSLTGLCLSVWLHSVQLLVGRGLLLATQSKKRLEGCHRGPTWEGHVIDKAIVVGTNRRSRH